MTDIFELVGAKQVNQIYDLLCTEPYSKQISDIQTTGRILFKEVPVRRGIFPILGSYTRRLEYEIIEEGDAISANVSLEASFTEKGSFPHSYFNSDSYVAKVTVSHPEGLVQDSPNLTSLLRVLREEQLNSENHIQSVEAEIRAKALMEKEEVRYSFY